MQQNLMWELVTEQREQLSQLLERLDGPQWDADSLCPGWRVRDVAAHAIAPATTGLGQVVRGMLAARGDFNRMILSDGRRRGETPVEEILGDYRRFAASCHRAPGAVGVTPLLDIMVHARDIAIALQLPYPPMPVGAATAAADLVWRLPFPFAARRSLAGYRLRAADTQWTVGEGALVQGPMEALLLLLTGRDAWLGRLEGPGAERLKMK
ncbi:maleylpyruvate isomerase family mycothiol-dependent enzyme [Glutamicibacter uratoxydans]|uniref:maleylpyruvate isomerase family mycothiol-dependent enzyme n=1 Tax=Glutamicibacter uratoxydans TaxID=43667 RepID=UPI003D6FC984